LSLPGRNAARIVSCLVSTAKAFGKVVETQVMRV
jgi:hypothetical protein